MQTPDLAAVGRLQTTTFTLMPNHFKWGGAGTLNTAEKKKYIYLIAFHYANLKRKSLNLLFF